MNQSPQDPPSPGAAPHVVPRPDQAKLQQMVVPIKSPATQVGESIVYALQQDNTVAVITTVVVGPDGGQHVVTAALNPSLMGEVQQLLARAAQERVEEEPCMGFHCLVRDKNETDGDKPTDAAPGPAAIDDDRR